MLLPFGIVRVAATTQTEAIRLGGVMSTQTNFKQDYGTILCRRPRQQHLGFY